jgi:hypothetical protein
MQFVHLKFFLHYLISKDNFLLEAIIFLKNVLCFIILKEYIDLLLSLYNRFNIISMNYKHFIAVLIVVLSTVKIAQAQQSPVAGPSDTLVVLWTSGDHEIAQEACLMYAHAAKKNKWFKEVILIVWGPSQKLAAEDSMIKEKIASMQKDGVIVQACVACSNMLGVTDELKACSIDVKGMGIPLTMYLKRGYKVVTF